MKKYDVIIVGAGISGCTLAERYANLGKSVLVVEKRSHIGGNCYDYVNKYGIRISKYGAHLFHTNYEDVWEYVQRFSNWYEYEHKVLSKVGDKLVPVPINILTVNELFNLNIHTQEEMENWLRNEIIMIKNPKNSEESALSRMGKRLYELMFKNYTKKQWDIWPKELEASVMNRIPVRINFNDRYFSDKYQFLPTKGYTAMFKKMLDSQNITVKLNTDYIESIYSSTDYDKLYFTGPIDEYFQNKYTKLQYRSIKFRFKTYKLKNFQENSVINYPNEELFTRIVEYKYFTKQKSQYTTISKEYSTWEGDPYYPVPTKRNQSIYKKYQFEAKKLEKDGIYFVGRLANYKYFNMDEAFKNALDLFASHQENTKW